MNIDIDAIYKQAVAHVETHDCSAHPYKYSEQLLSIIEMYQPRTILEIGTGIGMTAVVMAQGESVEHITTIEKDEEHVQMAQAFIHTFPNTEKVNLVGGMAEQLLKEMQQQFDLIFFDGYQIHYEFLPHYQRLLKSGGMLVLANNHLKSKTSDRFFAELQDVRVWRIINQFGDTTVVQRI